jgi:hypothetical protein
MVLHGPTEHYVWWTHERGFAKTPFELHHIALRPQWLDLDAQRQQWTLRRMTKCGFIKQVSGYVNVHQGVGRVFNDQNHGSVRIDLCLLLACTPDDVLELY